MTHTYCQSDQSQLLELLRLNTPKYFGHSEAPDFVEYLDKKLEDYFVVEKDSAIIGCGGINYQKENKIAVISWDMIHPDFHGQGIGGALLQFRIDKIKGNTEIQKIIVRTSQFAHVFYGKGGFNLIEIVDDYWADGIHLYRMEMVV